MTQSDSPDFEFDISDLEVEREESAASKAGTGASSEREELLAVDESEVVEEETVKRDYRAEFDESDRELDVFEIDDLPSSEPAEPIAEKEAVSPAEGEPAVAERTDASPENGEPELQPVHRIEEKPEPSPSRVLGEDDLGADVFSEIESALGSMGLDDVIDDLMEEVDDFEAGGFVELDEEEQEGAASSSDDVFKMSDPDDSLRNSIDPNAEEAEPVSEVSSFPSPPADFEIPADTEPPRSRVAESPAPQSEPVEAPVEKPQEPVAASEPVADPEVEEPLGQTAPDLSDFEIPADPEASAAGPDEASEPAVESREQVFFSAEQEEAAADVPEAAVEEEVVSDLPPSTIEDEPEEGEAQAPEAKVGEEVDAPSVDESADPPADAVFADALEEALEEEDLSALIEAIEEDDAEVESSVETPEEAASDAAVAEDAEPDTPAAAEDAEEEEDISGLVASVIEEEELSAEEPTEAVPGMAEVEEEEIPGLQEVEEEEGEEILADLPSPPEDLPVEEAAANEEELVAPEASELAESDEVLDEADISSLIGAASEGEPAAGEASSPSLDVVDDEEEEAVDIPVVEGPGLEEVPEEGGDDSKDETAAVSAAPAIASSEDLLKMASGLLNGDVEKPAEGASALLDTIDDDDEEIVSLPSPEEMIAGAADSDDEEIVVLPDAASLLTEDGEAVAVIDDEEDIPAPANVADRAGNLPPPPPAPIEILDEEPPEEDTQAAVPEEEPAAEPESEAPALEDPFSSEISLDDFNEGFAELDVVEDAEELDDSEINGEATGEEEEGGGQRVAAETVVVMPKPGLLWRVTHSMAVAAGLVLIGLAGVLAVWKQQIVEYYDGRDIDGSALLLEIEEIGRHALGQFDEKGLYRMQWVDSEVRRVSENEIRLHAVVGAQLRENLYRPVLESRLESEKGHDESQLLRALTDARDLFPEEIANFPDRPWDRLYEISAQKDEVLPLKVTYGLKREKQDADWELARIKVSGYKGDLEWPEGEPKYAFGENAYDIDSGEFAKVYAGYNAEAQNYVARIDRLKAREENGILALKRDNERQRELVKMALAEGTFFNGLAILGEDASDSRDVQLVITEVRNEGGFVKGVVKLPGEKDVSPKYFVGSLEFEKSMSGREQGFLSLRTVAIDAPEGSADVDTPFFDAHNVSRMRLRADGFRLEGDSRDLSFRLTRSL